MHTPNALTTLGDTLRDALACATTIDVLGEPCWRDLRDAIADITGRDGQQLSDLRCDTLRRWRHAVRNCETVLNEAVELGIGDGYDVQSDIMALGYADMLLSDSMCEALIEGQQ